MKLNVNGVDHDIDVEPDTPLLWAIREELGMTGTKFGCGIAQCGACTVWIDGVATRSCVMPVGSVENGKITTIEALSDDPVGQAVQAEWIKEQVPQCGYCQSGQLMAAASLLKRNPKPSREDIIGAMTNICRCGTYSSIITAIENVADAKGA